MSKHSGDAPSRTLSLGWLTLANASNEELIIAAAEAGFNAVGLRTAPRPKELSYSAATRYEMTDQEVVRLSSVLADHRMNALHVGGFWLDTSIDVLDYERHLAYASTLGASMAIAIAVPSMLRSEIVDRVASLAELSAKYDIRLAIEFALYTGVKTIEQANEVVKEIGRDNVGILVDALHLYRSGGTFKSIAHVDPERIFLAQLCDGQLRSPSMDLIPSEARYDRRDPGEGQLPLSDFLNALPPSVPLEVEVPKLSSKEMSSSERARVCFQVTDQFINDSLKY